MPSPALARARLPPAGSARTTTMSPTSLRPLRIASLRSSVSSSISSRAALRFLPALAGVVAPPPAASGVAPATPMSREGAAPPSDSPGVPWGRARRSSSPPAVDGRPADCVGVGAAAMPSIGSSGMGKSLSGTVEAIPYSSYSSAKPCWASAAAASAAATARSRSGSTSSRVPKPCMSKRSSASKSASKASWPVSGRVIASLAVWSASASMS
mmetsp:Transcript_55980/g.177400  ORF Transcript_55980/g.177400 Transcript_55980/m.177400 type:complete len:212 (+) Transcript_55980:415-1050(+)